MNARLSDALSRREVEPRTVLDLLAQSETPALATDGDGHVVFWNHAAERVFGRTTNQVLGRRCFDMVGGRDVFGNRFCHENCAVLAMARKGESVRSFEMAVESAPRQEQMSVTVLRVPGSHPEQVMLVHLLQPIDQPGRLARALEELGAREREPARASALAEPAVRGPVAPATAPPLTAREREILRLVVTGLQNKDIAEELGLSVATVRNHVHHILEKLEVHSKLEAASLAFREGWVTGADGAGDRGAGPGDRLRGAREGL